MSSNDPYAAGKFSTNPYAKKSDVTGQLVAVLDGRMENRGLSLITPPSRCVCRQQLHELILTDEAAAGPGAVVNRIAYLGFFEVTEGGVLLQGDKVWLDSSPVGIVAGFDETHMPNHLNIVIKTTDLKTGLELAAELGNPVRFSMPQHC